MTMYLRGSDLYARVSPAEMADNVKAKIEFMRFFDSFLDRKTLPDEFDSYVRSISIVECAEVHFLMSLLNHVSKFAF